MISLHDIIDTLTPPYISSPYQMAAPDDNGCMAVSEDGERCGESPYGQTVNGSEGYVYCQDHLPNGAMPGFYRADEPEFLTYEDLDDDSSHPSARLPPTL